MAHYPGWSLAVLKYLYEERKITASGHETTDTDPGIATSKGDYSLETYILGTDHYQIELLTNLDKVPEAGADRGRGFPEAEGRIGISGQGVCDCAVKRKCGRRRSGERERLARTFGSLAETFSVPNCKYAGSLVWSDRYCFARIR